MQHHKNSNTIMKRITMIFIIMIIIISIVPGVTSFSSEWKKYWDSYIGNIPNIFLRWQAGKADANAGDIYGWYNETSLVNIALWELLFCASDLAPEVVYASSSSSGEGTNPVYVTTITMTALKNKFNETESLYEISWYIQPLTFDIPYRVYLTDQKGSKHYLPDNNNRWNPAPALNGASGYFPFYSPAVYKKATIEYNESLTTKTFEVSVIEKKEQ